ncbi:MAG TPA: UDP-N-acetylmuramoyl-L-alanyl-D-glutamate--2,6-diaminopimelate ligase, partial [candidate division Zixibacteria bacterium]|nr:UDP-N-acetylmuramoyl-L-alanyl-D-glutamate--2,6-diaminopimelate ligase [candidate division Zixibacteria bacterium]
MRLEELIKSVSGAELSGGGDLQITGLEYDSRRVKPGMLFIAVEGYKMDGNQFIPDAVKNGAVAVMTAKSYNGTIPAVIVPDLRQAMADTAAQFYGYPG